MRNRPTGPAVHAAARRLKGRRPRVECLETRQLLANFTVTTAADTGMNSLRDVLTQLQSSTDPSNTIDFAITGGGQHFIAPVTPLPAITQPVLIDGYTQSGSRANALPQGTNAVINIEVLGSGLGASGVGFSVQSQNVTIQGLTISQFATAAIEETTGSGNDAYQGDYIGTDAAGTTALGNGIGIILASVGSTVGGSTPAVRNLISANTSAAVSASGAGVSSVVIADNMIGTDSTGLAVLHNPLGVVFTAGVTASTIGGNTSQAQNIISGNSTGVLLSGIATTGNLIAGNFVGPNIAGGSGIANTTGIEVTAPGNTIGGSSANFRNLISYNTANGVQIDSSVADASGTVVIGNYIGVTAVGNSAGGNAIGVVVNGVDHVTIGGAGGAANLISGNTNAGVQITGANASNNVVQANLIGTDSTGATSVPNGTSGVLISGGTNNLIGGSTAAARNVISGNAQTGVLLNGGSSDTVQNNYIGTDISGKFALGNSLGGISIQSSFNTISANLISANSGSGVTAGSTGISGNLIVGNTIGLDSSGSNKLGNSQAGISILAATGTTIGGSSAAARNIISSNSLGGISVGGGALSAGTLIQGNYIGTDSSGALSLPNQFGVDFVDTSSGTIGGVLTGQGNLIGDGVTTGTGSSGILIAGNFMGTNAAGTASLGSSLTGVTIGGTNSTVGGTVAGARNLISGATTDAITLNGTGNLVAGNYIGLNSSGNAAIGNSANGVTVNAANNTIGGTSVGARNVISSEGGDGVFIEGTTSITISGTVIAGNYIGTDSTGALAFPDSVGVFALSGGNSIGVAVANGGNLISGNTGLGIRIGSGVNGFSIVNNVIGVNAAGKAALPNSTTTKEGGIGLQGAANVTIGGTPTAARNIISGNTGFGISTGGLGALIENNYVGTDSTGGVAIANTADGIDVNSAQATIGGTVAGSGNVVSGNFGTGVSVLFGPVPNILIEGNTIGTDPTHTKVLGNTVDGIRLGTSVSGVTIGGSALASNIIENNGSGIVVINGTGNSILTNTISNSKVLGIDLGGTGVPTTNAPGGPHTGANNLLNYPVITKASSSSTFTEVTGTYNSAPNTQFTLQFFSSPAANQSNFGEGATFLGSTVVTTDGTGNATFDAILGVLTTADGKQVVSATATDPTHNTSEFSRDAIVVNAATALSISISTSPTPAYAGVALTYMITVTNQGPNPATNVTVTDPLPSNAAYVANSATSTFGSTPTITSGVLTALIGTLPANTTAIITFQVIPNFSSPPNLADTATLTSSENPSMEADSSVTILPAADLSVVLTATPSPTTTPLLDQFLTYVATVTNIGVSAATNVTLDDILPFMTAGAATIPLVAFQSASVSQGTFTTQFASDGVTVSEVDANLGTLNSGFAATLTIRVQTTNLGVITDSATAGTGIHDTNTANNTATNTVSVQPASDLSVSISGAAATNNGQPYTYFVTVTNNGPSNDTGGNPTSVTLSNMIPANSVLSTITPPTVTGGGTVTEDSQHVFVSFASLLNGESETLTVVVVPNKSTPLTTQATVSGVVSDPNLANNTASLTTTVNPSADLAVAITAPAANSSFFVGAPISYDLTLSNLGPDQANSVLATDTLPTGVTLESVFLQNGTFSVSGQVITFNLGTLASGQNVAATITALTTSAAVGTATDSATISDNDVPAIFDPNTANNSASVASSIGASADVGVTLTANPNPALVGQPLSYLITVSNSGPSPATGVFADDLLPDGVILSNVSVSQGTFSSNSTDVFLNLGTIAAGSSATATITVIAGTQAGATLVNSVQETANEFDPITANNSATIMTQVNPFAGLTVVGTSSPDTILIGQNVTYIVDITNNGPSDGTDVTLLDTLPSSTSFVSIVTPAGTSSGVNGNVVTVSLGSLPLGQTAEVQITVHSLAVGTITNTATATAVEFPDGSTTFTSTVVNPTADVSVSLVALPSQVLLGQNFTYTANVLNNGPSTSTGVVVTDTLPAGVIVDSATSSVGTVTISNGVATLIVGDLISGSLATLTLVVTPISVGSISNVVNVSSTDNDGNMANNSATATNTVIPAANLVVTAASSPDPAALHQNLIFTLKVTNPGPSNATNVVLRDTLPAQAAFIFASLDLAPGVTYSPAAGVLIVPIGDLAIGQTATVTLVVSPMISGTSNNTTTVTADQANTTPGSSTVNLVVVAGIPGSLEFSSPTFSAAQNSGSATIFVNRVGGVDGAVSIHYTATAGTGQSNVDFTPVSGSLFFADGQTVASFTVPILDSASTTSNKTVNLTLSQPIGGATLGSTTSAVLTIVATNTGGGGGTMPENTAPQVTNLHRIGIHAQPTQLVLTFSTPLTASTAENVANYQVVSSSGGAPIPIASATYNATNSTVTLLMAERLNVHKTYFLTVFTGLTGSTGIALASNYVAAVDFGTLGLTKTKIAVQTVHPAKVVKAKVVKAKAVSHWASHLTTRMPHAK